MSELHLPDYIAKLKDVSAFKSVTSATATLSKTLVSINSSDSASAHMHSLNKDVLQFNKACTALKDLTYVCLMLFKFKS